VFLKAGEVAVGGGYGGIVEGGEGSGARKADEEKTGEEGREISLYAGQPFHTSE
jgi:hypothetical protein